MQNKSNETRLLKKILSSGNGWDCIYLIFTLGISDKMTMLPPDPIYIFKGEMLSVSCLEFQMTRLVQRIYAGTQSGNVHVWNLKSKREVGHFKAGDDVCLSVCLPQEEGIVITHTKAGDVAFWTEAQAKWQLKTLIKTNFFGFCKCQVLDDILYVPVKNSKCQLISVKTQDTLRTVNLEWDSRCEIMAFKVCVIGQTRFVLVAYEGHRLGLWDLDDLKRKSQLELSDCPMALDYDVVTNKGLCGDPSDKLVVFSLDDSLELKVERSITLMNAGVAAVRIRPDGKLAAVGCWDGKLRLYSWKSLVLLAVLDIHSATVQDVAFVRHHEDGFKPKYLLAAASKDSTISLWDLYNEINNK